MILSPLRDLVKTDAVEDAGSRARDAGAQERWSLESHELRRSRESLFVELFLRVVKQW